MKYLTILKTDMKLKILNQSKRNRTGLIKDKLE